MQLMPRTARMMGVKKIFSPQENIAAGTRFLRYMIDAFDGDLEMGLAAYNAGAGAVKKYGSVPPYRETKNYVDNVFRFYRKYGSYTSGKITSYTDEKGCLNIYNER
jgi:soluble lytic murein transglycosylase-like protein